MNKLYLLSALVAATYAATSDDDACMTSDDFLTSDGDYAYTFSFTEAKSADGTTPTICYYNFVYDFGGITPVATSNSDDVSTEFDMFAIAATGKKAKNVAFDDSTDGTSAYAELATAETADDTSIDDGIVDTTSDYTTKSSGDKSAGAAGY
jgi:hypothetical protein